MNLIATSLLLFSLTGVPPEVSPTGPEGGDPITQTLKTNSGGWWAKTENLMLNANGILPQSDSAIQEMQTPIAYAEATEPGETPGYYIYDETPAELINLESVLKLLEYPAPLIEQEIEGLVTVRIEVDYNGKVIGFHIMRSTHSLMSQTARTIIPELQFIPARQAGRPVKAFVTLPLKFELKDEKPQTTR